MQNKSLERSRSREKDQMKKSLDSKRGIFTSKYEEKPHANVYLESSLPGFNQSHEEHIHKRIINHNQFLQVPHQLHTNIHMGGRNYRQQHSHRTPPPEVRFNYLNGSREGSPIKYIPITNQAHQRITHSYYPNAQNQSSVAYYPQQNVQIRKTFIPQHIYNYIDKNQTSQYQESKQIKPNPENKPIHTDQAYNVLLREYQKLYGKFESECEHTKQLEIMIDKLKKQLTKQVVTPQNNDSHHAYKRNQNYSLSIQLLHDRIYTYYEKFVDAIIKARRQKCLERLSKVFQAAHKQISTSVVIEETTSYKWNG